MIGYIKKLIINYLIIAWPVWLLDWKKELAILGFIKIDAVLKTAFWNYFNIFVK